MDNKHDQQKEECPSCKDDHAEKLKEKRTQEQNRSKEGHCPKC
jgi:hypothetical protein